jgi:hypothetical protein
MIKASPKQNMNMIKLSAVCAFLVVFGSAASPAAEEPGADVAAPDALATSLKGTFVGAFGEHKITICIDRVIGRTVTGYSIVAGNERAFSGSFQDHEQGFAIVVEEPGDHADDGIFKMIYARETDDLGGIWKPNDAKRATEKVFVLPRRVFKYNPKAGAYPQSSIRILTEKDVENLRPADLRIMRNEIYARRGYGFKLADMRAHFEKLDWYMAVSQDITDSLTPMEKKNADLIKRYENYGEEYYDSFGR